MTDHKDSAATIGVAIVAAAIIIIGGWIGYTEYKEAQAIKFLNQMGREFEKDTERRIQKREERREQRRYEQQKAKEQAELEKRRKAEYERKLEQHISEECRFWKLQNQENPTDRTATKVKRHCPFG